MKRACSSAAATSRSGDSRAHKSLSCSGALLCCLLSLLLSTFSPPPLLLLTSAHSDDATCSDRTAVATSDPSLCCPSVEYVLEANPRGTGPRCTQCRFDRFWCADGLGGCCHTDGECAIDATSGAGLCVIAGAALGAPLLYSNRSATDPHRDRVPSATSVEGQSATVVLFFAALLVVSVLVAAVVVCETGACKKKKQEHQQQQQQQQLAASDVSTSAAGAGVGACSGGSFIGRRADAVTVASARRQECRSISLAKARRADADAESGDLELQRLTARNEQPLEASDELVFDRRDNDEAADADRSSHATES